MTDVVFAFGPGESYFFESQTQWRMRSLPPRLLSKFAVGTDVAHVYQLALGSGDTWFMSYRTRSGGASFAHDGLPEKLAAWLRVRDASGHSVRNIAKLKISLGPRNSSFWVEDGKDYYWDGLPEALQTALKQLISPQGGWIRAPKIVLMGIHNSYVLITEGGGGSYAVADYYPWLHKELTKFVQSSKAGALKDIHHISIDQHDGGSFILLTAFGDFMFYLPQHLNADFTAIRNTVPKGPASSIMASRQIETAHAPDARPQTTAVQALPTYAAAPEEFDAPPPQPGVGPAGNTVRISSPNQFSGTPAPPYSSGHPHSVGAQSSTVAQTINESPPLVPGQFAQLGRRTASPPNNGIAPGQFVQLGRRTASPPNTYQHPHVANLENVAASGFRINSPENGTLPSATTGSPPPVADPSVQIVSSTAPGQIHSPRPGHVPLPVGTAQPSVQPSGQGVPTGTITQAATTAASQSQPQGAQQPGLAQAAGGQHRIYQYANTTSQELIENYMRTHSVSPQHTAHTASPQPGQPQPSVSPVQQQPQQGTPAPVQPQAVQIQHTGSPLQAAQPPVTPFTEELSGFVETSVQPTPLKLPSPPMIVNVGIYPPLRESQVQNLHLPGPGLVPVALTDASSSTHRPSVSGTPVPIIQGMPPLNPVQSRPQGVPQNVGAAQTNYVSASPTQAGYIHASISEVSGVPAPHRHSVSTVQQHHPQRPSVSSVATMPNLTHVQSLPQPLTGHAAVAARPGVTVSQSQPPTPQHSGIPFMPPSSPTHTTASSPGLPRPDSVLSAPAGPGQQPGLVQPSVTTTAAAAGTTAAVTATTTTVQQQQQQARRQSGFRNFSRGMVKGFTGITVPNKAAGGSAAGSAAGGATTGQTAAGTGTAATTTSQQQRVAAQNGVAIGKLAKGAVKLAINLAS